MAADTGSAGHDSGLAIVREVVVGRASGRSLGRIHEQLRAPDADQQIAQRGGLAVHACFMVFPLLLPGAALLAWRRRDRDTGFLAAWIGLFFCGSAVLFFAGSARYLLPMAAPMALLVSRLRVALAGDRIRGADGFEPGAGPGELSALGCLPAVCAADPPATAGHRVYIDGEWGPRFYLEADGGVPLERGQVLRAGDIVVSNELAYPIAFTAPTATIAEKAVRASLPLQLIGLEAHSGYSTVTKGLRPFDISNAPIDIVRAAVVLDRHPTLSYLPMNAPEAGDQIVSGLYDLEGGAWRWMAGSAVVLVKSPDRAMPAEAVLTIPDAAPARHIELSLDGRVIASESLRGSRSLYLEVGASVTHRRHRHIDTDRRSHI